MTFRVFIVSMNPLNVKDIFQLIVHFAPQTLFNLVRVCRLFRSFYRHVRYDSCIWVRQYMGHKIMPRDQKRKLMRKYIQFCHLGLTQWRDLNVLPLHITKLTLDFSSDCQSLRLWYDDINFEDAHLQQLDVIIRHAINEYHVEAINSVLRTFTQLKIFSFQTISNPGQIYILELSESIEECVVDSCMGIRLNKNIVKFVDLNQAIFINTKEVFEHLIHLETNFSNYGCDYQSIFPNLKICKIHLRLESEYILLGQVRTIRNLLKHEQLKSLTFNKGFTELAPLPSQLEHLSINTKIMKYDTDFPDTLTFLHLKCKRWKHCHVKGLQNLQVLTLRCANPKFTLNMHDFSKLEHLCISSPYLFDDLYTQHTLQSLTIDRINLPLRTSLNAKYIHIHTLYAESIDELNSFLNHLSFACQYVIIDEFNHDVNTLFVKQLTLKSLIIQGQNINLSSLSFSTYS